MQESPRVQTTLVVDDSDVIRDIMRVLLEQAGYKVFDASTGRKALEIIRDPRNTVNAVISDIVMPGMNGLELAEQIASLNPGINLLFTSSLSRSTVLRGDARYLVHSFLHKPFTQDEFLTAVRQAFGARQVV